MKLFCLTWTASLFLAVAANAQSNSLTSDAVLDPRNEIVFGVNPLLGLGGNATGGEAYVDHNGTNGIHFNLAGSYNRAISRVIQLGLNTSFFYTDNALLGANAFQLLAGPTFNFPFSDDVLYNSLFFSVKLGLGIVTVSGASKTEALFNAELGYRCKVFDHFAWRPSISMLKNFDNALILFAARPLSFAVIF